MKTIAERFEERLKVANPHQPERMADRTWALHYVRLLAEVLDEAEEKSDGNN